jgi:hypothetical protein
MRMPPSVMGRIFRGSILRPPAPHRDRFAMPTGFGLIGRRSRDDQPLRTLSDGAGGFLPRVPLETPGLRFGRAGALFACDNQSGRAVWMNGLMMELLKTEVPGSSFEEVTNKLREEGMWTGELLHHAKDGRVLTIETLIQIESVGGRRLALQSSVTSPTGNCWKSAGVPNTSKTNAPLTASPIMMRKGKSSVLRRLPVTSLPSTSESRHNFLFSIARQNTELLADFRVTWALRRGCGDVADHCW